MKNYIDQIKYHLTRGYDISNPYSLGKLTEKVKSYIEARHLAIELDGKPYVKVEGWQYVGHLLGISPLVVAARDARADGSIHFDAKVELYQNGQVVGSGQSTCSNTEEGKENMEENALLSMAQTRATGKAFRLKLAWILDLAGYKTTPAEEMADARRAEPLVAEEVKSKIQGTWESAKALLDYASSLKHLAKVPEFRGLVSTRLNKLKQPA